MKLFGRTGGHYLFWTGLVYLVAGITAGIYKWTNPVYAQMGWIIVMMMPFVVPPLGRFFNMSIEWDRKMFKLFGKKDKVEDNVVKFPQLAQPTPPMPEVTPPKEKDPVTFYRLGLTDNNRVSFQMGYTEITMNSVGIQQMIDQLEFFQSQLYDNEPTDDPDGGLPLPEEVENRKAA
jgi:hypothetical protein